MAELLGQHRYQLDQKGRIALPKRYLEALSSGAYLTLGQDGCLWIFPPEEFERQGQRIRSAPLSDPSARAYARMFFSSTEPVTPDAQGRLTLPPRLRNLLGMGRDVVVMGVSDHLEVWDGPTWDRYEEQHSVAYRSGALSLGGV